MSGRDRRKGEAVGTAPEKAQPPPNVKKFRLSLAELTERIKEKETQRKRLGDGVESSSQLNGELSRATSELSEIGQLRTGTAAEVHRVEDQVRRLGPEISNKRGESSRLVVGLRYKSNERIDDALSKLRQQLLTRQYSNSEEKRLQSEIDNLENSKEELREYVKTKAEIEEMIQEQEKLRERRNSLYRQSRELRSREGEVKDRQTQLRREFSERRDKKKDVQQQKDSLTEEIDALYKERQRLRDDFKRAQSEYLTTNSEQEMEERERESERRDVERKERRRRQDHEAEMRREMKYEEEKLVCRTLLVHLEKVADPTVSVITATSNGGPGLDPQRSHSSPATAAPGRGGEQFKQPGVFLPRKTEDQAAYLVPSSSSKRKSRRDKKRHTASGKAGRRLQYDPVVLSQFEFLSVLPPTTHSQIPHVLHILREKLAFYEHKTTVCSEAGDSGIESQALGDVVAEQDLNSQEEFDNTSPHRHPPKSLPLSSNLPPPLLTNGGPVSPSSSSPLTPLAVTEQDKVLNHSVSTSTTASNNSTTALVQPTVE